MSDYSFLERTVPIWDSQPFAERLQLAITALSVHGVIPKSEAVKAYKRLNKMWDIHQNKKLKERQSGG